MENLQATELRIGNLLSFSGEPVAINAGFIYDCDYWNRNPERQDAVLFENVEPIPLTAEWLERLGFQTSGGTYYEKDGIGLITGYAVDGTFVCGNSFGSRHTHFYDVHQLQNLYFALTGEELMIQKG